MLDSNRYADNVHVVCLRANFHWLRPVSGQNSGDDCDQSSLVKLKDLRLELSYNINGRRL